MNTNTQPVWTYATLVALAAAVLALLAAFGVPITEDMKLAIMSIVAILAPFAAAKLTSPKVTPLAAPEDEDGTPLVRATDGQVTNSQMRSMLKKDG